MPTSEKKSATAASPATGKVETLSRIMKAAREEFASKGLEGAHVQTIATNAGVTKQLIYHYYVNKENLFACVLDETSDEAMSELAALDLCHLPPADALREMLYKIFDHFHNDPVLSSLASEGIRYHDSNETPRNRLVEIGPQLTSKMDNIIQRGVAEGLFRDELNSHYVFSAAILLVCGPYTQRYLIESLSTIDLTDGPTIEGWKVFAADMILAALSSN